MRALWVCAALAMVASPAAALERYSLGDAATLDALEVVDLGAQDVAAGVLVLTGADDAQPAFRLPALRDGVVEVVLDYRDHAFVAEGYQARLALAFTGSDFDPAAPGGPGVRVTHRVHDTIDYSWYELGALDAVTYLGGVEPRAVPGQLRLRREDGEVSAWFRGDGPWVPVDYNEMADVPAPRFEGPVGVAVYVERDFAPDFHIELEGLTVMVDGDGDGLLDDEEALFGTDPDRADSDDDGLDDLRDPLPLDPAFDAPFVPRVDHTVDGFDVILRATVDGRLALVVINTTAQDAEFRLDWPGLGEGFVRAFVGGEVADAADGLRDTVPAYGRRVYVSDGDAPPLIAAALDDVAVPVAGGPARVPLGDLGFDLTDGREGLVWSVAGVAGDDAVEVAVDGDALIVTPRGGDCGVAQVMLRLTDAAGRTSTAPITVRAVGAPSGNLLENPGFEDGGPSPVSVPGWMTWVWEGSFRVEATDVEAAEGSRAVLVEGDGAGRAGIFQTLRLPAGTYRFEGTVGAQRLGRDVFGQSSAVFVDVVGAAPIVEPLIGEDTGWSPFTLEFSLAEEADVVLYVLAYGPGRLWVDDLALTSVGDCAAPVPATLEVQPGARGPVGAAVPPRPEDAVMCGLCDRAGMPPALCRACDDLDLDALAPPRAEAPLPLADFEPGRSSVFDASSYLTVPGLDGAGAARVEPGGVLFASDELGLPTDWTGHDWLRLEVHNDGQVPQPLRVLVRDATSVDRNTQLTWESLAPPGRSTVRVPLGILMGESTYLGARRRLDLTRVRQIRVELLGATDALTFDGVALEPEAAIEGDHPHILKLDAGLPGGVLRPSFHPLLERAGYRPERGYGLSDETLVYRVEDRRFPDPALRDWISFRQGGLRFDLPDGRYHGWMVLDDPGYWEFFQQFAGRVVRVEGVALLDEAPTVEEWMAVYYAHADREDRPGDDVWATYVAPRYRPVRFTVDVTDGHLDIELGGTTFGATLSTLVLWPDDIAARGDTFVEALWARMAEQFADAHREVRPPVAPLEPGLTLFRRTPGAPVYADDAPLPEEKVNRLTLALAAGETSPLTLSMRSDVDRTLVEARLEVPGFDVEGWSVRHQWRRVARSGRTYQSAPWLLDPLGDPVAVPAGVSRRLWFLVSAAPGTVSGDVDGTLTLRFEDGDEVTRPVTISVRPFGLPAVDLALGYRGLAGVYPATTYPEVEAKRRAEVDAAAALLRRAGLNAVTGGLGGPEVLGYDDAGDLLVDFTTADETVQAAQAAGFEGPWLADYGLRLQGLGEVFAPLQTVFERPWDAVLDDALAAVAAHAEDAGWPPLIWLVGDAPEGAQVGESLALADALRAADPAARTAVAMPLSNPEAPQAAFFEAVDRVLLTGHTEEVVRAAVAAGAEVMTTGRTDRYRQGLYQFALRRLGASGHYESSFSEPTVDPYFALDGRDDDFGAAVTHPTGAWRPTMAWARTQLAVTDLRYLMALEAALDAAPRARVTVAARAFFDELLQAMAIGDFAARPWTDAEIDGLRDEMAHHIALLGDAEEEVWDWGPEAGVGDGGLGDGGGDGEPFVDGSAGEGGKSSDGCDCRASEGGGATPWLALLALAALRRRR